MVVLVPKVWPGLKNILCWRGDCGESTSDSMQRTLPSSSVKTCSWIVIFEPSASCCPNPVKSFRSELPCLGDALLDLLTYFDSFSKRTSSLFLRNRDGLFTLLSNSTGWVLWTGKQTLCCFRISELRAFSYFSRLLSRRPFSISLKAYFSCRSSFTMEFFWTLAW